MAVITRQLYSPTITSIFFQCGWHFPAAGQTTWSVLLTLRLGKITVITLDRKSPSQFSDRQCSSHVTLKNFNPDGQLRLLPFRLGPSLQRGSLQSGLWGVVGVPSLSFPLSTWYLRRLAFQQHRKLSVPSVVPHVPTASQLCPPSGLLFPSLFTWTPI